MVSGFRSFSQKRVKLTDKTAHTSHFLELENNEEMLFSTELTFLQHCRTLAKRCSEGREKAFFCDKKSGLKKLVHFLYFLLARSETF